MINFFYIYAIICWFILFLYSLKLSEYCNELNQELLLFFIVTSFISLVIGILYRKKFICISIYEIPKFYPNLITIILLMNFLGEIFICGKSILIEILLGNLGMYGDRTTASLPVIHFILITFSSFYSLYLLMLVFISKNRQYLFHYFALNFVGFILFANRGGLIFSLFIAINMWLFFNKKNKFIRKISQCCFIGLIFLYLFGMAGNIRHGYDCYDSSYIIKLGKIKEIDSINLLSSFSWAYMYAVEPLFNFNHNVETCNISYNYLLYIKEFLPDFINKRFLPKEHNRKKLVFESFNTCIGFTGAYISGGLIGAFFMYFLFTALLLWVIHIIPLKGIWSLILYLMIDAVIVFFFFTNSWQYSAMSFQITYPILIMLMNKIFRSYNLRIDCVKPFTNKNVKLKLDM